MKVMQKGSVYVQPCNGGEFRFEFWPVNGSNGGFEHLGTFVKTCEVEFEIEDDLDPRASLVESLEREKTRVAADYQKRITEINAQIQSLLAIEA